METLSQFEREFHDDLAVIALAIERYGLPKTLKLGVHSGSDKFSLYPIIRRTLPKYDAGLHLKTAGTTWLEELIGSRRSGRRRSRALQGDLRLRHRAHRRAHRPLCRP